MAGMQDTKNRIKSVQSTKKITKAMELVASAKLKRARDRFEESRVFFDTVAHDIKKLLKDSRITDHVYVKEREVKKSLYIVISSDLGLCGGYNSNVYKKVRENAPRGSEFILLGSKAVSHYKHEKVDVLKNFAGVTAHPEISIARSVANIAINRFVDGKVDEIILVSTKFINSVTFESQLTKLLPVDTTVIDDDFDSKSIVEYEPSPESLLDYLVPRYVDSSIYGAMIESLVSEQASRRMAMENASENAEELIDKLKLQYNRARQAAITQEISEIVAGADAL
jgi:F-type H+-transporting ATPase subunit gamma